MCYERGHEEGFSKGYDEGYDDGYDEGVGDMLKVLEDFTKKWKQSSNGELREKVVEIEDESNI